MPKYYVGFDFGTHQTKICIKNTTTRPHSYSFLASKDLDGVDTYLFPSAVAIDNNGKINYGFVDCDALEDKGEVELLEKLREEANFDEPEPELVLPPKPTSSSNGRKFKGNGLESLGALLDVFSGKSNLQSDSEKWEKECQEIKFNYSTKLEEWKGKSKRAELAKNELLFMQKEMPSKRRKRVLNYFKLACFNLHARSEFIRNNNIEPEKISVWYITYLLFSISESIGDDFFLQMGIPSGLNDSESTRQRAVAYRLLISAYKLKERYVSRERFLEADLNELNLHKLENSVDEALLDKYMIDVLPEAYAGLVSFTKKGKLTNGIHLLVDIGGGTTDVVLFTVNNSNKEPQLYAIKSIPIGLNNIFKDYLDDNNAKKTPDEIKNLFLDNQWLFSDVITKYHNRVKSQMDYLIHLMNDGFTSYRINKSIDISRMYEAIAKQPIVYCGGGSVFDAMLGVKIKYFEDQRVLSKKMIGDFNIQSEGIDEIFPILTNALGLSEPVFNDIRIMKIRDMFSFLDNVEEGSVPVGRFDSSDKDVTTNRNSGGNNLARVMNGKNDPYDLSASLEYRVTNTTKNKRKGSVVNSRR